MTLRRPATAWTLFALTFGCEIFAALFPDVNEPTRAIVLVGLPLVLTGACGALVAARRPDNPIGWILVCIALAVALGAAATQYGQRALVVSPGSLPGGVVAAWLQAWVSSLAVPLIILLLLLFPTGTYLSNRWRPIAWLAITASVVIIADLVFRPGFDTFPHVANPLAVRPLGSAAEWAGHVAQPAVGAAFIAAVASVVVRFRRSQSVERRQMKWFAYGTLTAVALAR